MPTPVTLIVVCHESRRHLPRLFACLGEQLLPARILVLDNASADGSAAAAADLVTADPRLAERTTVMRLEQNIGFAAANNRGIALADTEYVALLNPDAFPRPGWLAALLDAAGRHSDCAAFGSRQMQADQPDVIDGLGDCYSITGLAWRRGHGRRLTAADLVPCEIFSPCAAAALYRRAAVLDVGGFDEDYFCYFEDVDLGLRLRLRGERARYVPEAVVEHVGGGSSGGGRSATATYLGHRNLVWTAVKNLPFPLILASLLAQIPQAMISAVVCWRRGHLRDFLRSKVDAVRGCGACLKKRSTVQRMRRVTSIALWKSFQPSV
jgi:GT2 family glycosyltransferase